MRRLENETGRSDIGYLVKGVAGQRQVAPLHQAKSFFADVPEDQVSLGM